MIDMCFDALNVKNKLEGEVKRKGFRRPYTDPLDERFKVQIYVLIIHNNVYGHAVPEK